MASSVVQRSRQLGVPGVVALGNAYLAERKLGQPNFKLTPNIEPDFVAVRTIFQLAGSESRVCLQRALGA